MTTPEPQHMEHPQHPQHPQHTQVAEPAQSFAADPTPTEHVAAEPTPPSQPGYEHAAETSRPEGESLFGGIDMSGLRSRWDDVQAAFVDDPRECVQKADRLVSNVVEQLTTGFADARSRLEEQWSRGQEASTEDLRQALKRYREFFQRLLAVS